MTAQQPVPVDPAERRAYRQAIVATSALAGLGLVAAALAWVVASSGVAVAIATGAVVGAGFGLVSQVATLRAAGSPPHVFGAVVAGAWLGKMVVLEAALAAIARIEGFERAPFGVTLVIVVALTALADFWAVRRARLPYANTRSKTEPQ